MKNTRFGKYTRKIIIIGITFFFFFTVVNTLLTPSVKAQNTETELQNNITTWNGTKSISEEFTITENETVIIEPGTTIHLYQEFIEHKQLIVKGTLIANGTTDKPINFVGHLSNIEGTGYRPKIEFYDDTSSKSILNHAIIIGLYIDIIGSSMKILNSTITNDSTISITSTCSPIISGNIIKNNGVEYKSEPWYRPPYQEGEWSEVGGMGIYCHYGPTAIISNNTITHNAGIGLWIQSASPIVKNNIFSENRWCGIRIEDCWLGQVSKPVITNNIIKDHGLPDKFANPPKGYEVMPRVHPVGVDIENSDAFFSYNIFTNNEVGIANYQKLTGTPEFGNDTFVNNTIGAYSYSGSPIYA